MNDTERLVDETKANLQAGRRTRRSPAFYILMDFGNFLKTVYDAKLTFKGDFKEVVNLIYNMLDSTETNLNFEEREGLHCAYSIIERWRSQIEEREATKPLWEALYQAKKRMEAIEAGKE